MKKNGNEKAFPPLLDSNSSSSKGEPRAFKLPFELVSNPAVMLESQRPRWKRLFQEQAEAEIRYVEKFLIRLRETFVEREIYFGWREAFEKKDLQIFINGLREGLNYPEIKQIRKMAPSQSRFNVPAMKELVASMDLIVAQSNQKLPLTQKHPALALFANGEGNEPLFSYLPGVMEMLQEAVTQWQKPTEEDMKIYCKIAEATSKSNGYAYEPNPGGKNMDSFIPSATSLRSDPRFSRTTLQKMADKVIQQKLDVMEQIQQSYLNPPQINQRTRRYEISDEQEFRFLFEGFFPTTAGLAPQFAALKHLFKSAGWELLTRAEWNENNPDQNDNTFFFRTNNIWILESVVSKPNPFLRGLEPQPIFSLESPLLTGNNGLATCDRLIRLLQDARVATHEGCYSEIIVYLPNLFPEDLEAQIELKGKPQVIRESPFFKMESFLYSHRDEIQLHCPATGTVTVLDKLEKDPETATELRLYMTSYINEHSCVGLN